VGDFEKNRFLSKKSGFFDDSPVCKIHVQDYEKFKIIHPGAVDEIRLTKPKKRGTIGVQ
jgi:hypothetical protein